VNLHSAPRAKVVSNLGSRKCIEASSLQAGTRPRRSRRSGAREQQDFSGAMEMLE
jgi:hypothetical protein